MRIPSTRPILFVAAVTAVLALGACDDPGPVGPDTPTAEARVSGPVRAESPASLKIMTRNVFLGGNTGLVFGADFGNPLAVVAAAATVWAQVQASDIPARAAALADEIDGVRPHVVALQEVFRFQSTAGTVLDWLEILEAELAARGLPYTTVAVQQGTSANLPVSLGELVTFTDRIAVLVRDDVPLTALDKGTYSAAFPLVSAPPPIGDIVVRRGWIRLATERMGVPHHVVATHLETQGIRPVHDAQADELLNGVAAGLDGVTIVTGDLNSDAAAPEGAPSWTPTYGKLRAAGFADAWLESPASRTGDGFTCCQAPDLRNGSSRLDERVDFVLVRQGRPGSSALHFSGAAHAELLGDAPGDRTGSGLWPSDHAGLVAALRLPPGLSKAR